MTEITRFVGLDVHADSITVAVAEEGRSEVRHVGRFPNDLTRLLKALDRLGPRADLHCAYEAGPTGYGLQRALAKAGIECVVIAPSKTPRGTGDHVKTSARDATVDNELAGFAARYQQAVGKHWIFRLDGFAAGGGEAPDHGVRVEWRLKF